MLSQIRDPSLIAHEAALLRVLSSSHLSLLKNRLAELGHNIRHQLLALINNLLTTFKEVLFGFLKWLRDSSWCELRDNWLLIFRITLVLSRGCLCFLSISFLLT